MNAVMKPTPMGTIPFFVTQKRVQAARVIDVQHDAGSAFLVLDTNPGTVSVEVQADWIRRRCGGANPRGGYFIVYPADGYTSWCPATVFEDTATPEADYGLQVSQESKYTVGPRGRLVNRESGQPIPDDEPVMILRAQDRLAYEAVLRYRDHAEDQTAADAIRRGAGERLAAFANFALHCPYRMKDPS